MNQSEINRLQRIRRKQNHNAETYKYEKTPNGFLMRVYRNMQSRVTGVQKVKYHLYKGKYLLPRQDFYDWSLNNVSFYSLFIKWQQSGYNRKLTPTVDRIDSSKGYELSNMRWLTHSENSSLGSIQSHLLHPEIGEILLQSRLAMVAKDWT